MNNNLLYGLGTLTVLALVAQEVIGTPAGRLVSGTDCAVAFILTIILTCVQVTVWPCEACRASTGRRTWGGTEIQRDEEKGNRERAETLTLPTTPGIRLRLTFTCLTTMLLFTALVDNATTH